MARPDRGYRDRLPVDGPDPVVTLLEGGTPLSTPPVSERTGAACV